MRRPWSPEEEARLVEIGYRAFSEESDRSFHACRVKYHDLVRRGERREIIETALPEDIEEHPDVAVVKRKSDATDEDWERLFRALEDAETARAGLSPTELTTTATFPERLPIGVAFFSDIHAGASGVDYERFRRDMETLRDTPGLYGVMNGDLVENAKPMMKSGNALFHSLFARPREQWHYIRLRMKIAQGKWLVVTQGNHDARDGMLAGVDRLPDLARELGVPYATEAGITVYLEVGEQRYVAVVKHDYAGKSPLNKSNSPRRMWIEWPHSWESADIIALGHLHYCDVHETSVRGQHVVWLRSGSYKVHDEWAESKGYKSEYGVPVVVLYPDERRLVPFADFSSGVRFLQMERARYHEVANRQRNKRS